jgi:hypothetical protein
MVIQTVHDLLNVLVNFPLDATIMVDVSPETRADIDLLGLLKITEIKQQGPVVVIEV